MLKYLVAEWVFKFSAGSRTTFYEGLQVLVENGISVNDSLKELYDVWSIQGRKPDKPLALVANDLMTQLTSGEPLSKALSRWVPYEEASLFAAGEQSSRLSGAIEEIIRTIKSKQQIVGAVFGAVAYPSFLMVPMVFLLWMISHELVPSMARFENPENWQGAGWLLYQVSNFVTGYGLFALLSLIVAIVLLVYSLPRWTGRARAYADRMPFFAMYRMVHGSTFLLNLAVLMRANIAPYQALEMLAEYASPWLKERIKATQYGIRMGSNIGVAFDDAGYNFPDKKAIQFVRILASRDGFDKALNNYAQRWLLEGIKRLQLSARISFILSILFIGSLMGLVVMGTQDMQGSIDNSTQQTRR
ncbi:type II secretion system F family protein [Pseudomonas mosselii]|uniref:Type II secretion system F family protein n=1 Tax=Pseudomonas mosselii TaxID=78327 RepID=A0A7W2JZS2_9PSED|nr:type II secretion system F family protein [Pseudomonas mosselii]MBA6068116.1 type II secretion system F family protein [Pseudomonas mosselii]